MGELTAFQIWNAYVYSKVKLIRLVLIRTSYVSNRNHDFSNSLQPILYNNHIRLGPLSLYSNKHQQAFTLKASEIGCVPPYLLDRMAPLWLMQSTNFYVTTQQMRHEIPQPIDTGAIGFVPDLVLDFYKGWIWMIVVDIHVTDKNCNSECTCFSCTLYRFTITSPYLYVV